MKAKTISLYANPYHSLDHLGRLAGQCPEGELPRPAGSLPSRRSVGAERTMTGGSLVPDSADQGLRIAVADRGGNLAIAPFIMSTADVFWQFDADAHEYHIGDRRLEHFYSERVKHGEVFPAVMGGSEPAPPIRALAEARLAKIQDWQAHYGDEPIPFDVWAKQYPLDEKVATEQAKLEAEIAEAIAKAKADAEAKAKAAADAKAKAEADAKAAAAEEKRGKVIPPLGTSAGDASDTTKGS